jgi:hypothetical protein
MEQSKIIGFSSHFLGNAETYTLENRIFNAVMIVVSIVGSITTMYNVILNNHIILTACSATSVIFTLMAYGYSLRTRKFQLLVVPVVAYFILIMIISWLVNDGTKGASSDFFFILISIAILLLKKPFPLFYITIVMTLIGLLAVEFYYPSVIIGYETDTQRFLDMGVSMIMCLVFNGVMIHIVFREYLRERQHKNALLCQTLKDKEALELAHKEIKILKGLIPICASCKMVRDKKGNWNHLEEYLNEYSEAKLTHGICPDCATRLYPEFCLKQ